MQNSPWLQLLKRKTTAWEQTHKQQVKEGEEREREEDRKKASEWRNVDEHKAQMEIEKNCTENEDVLTAIKLLHSV